MRTFTHGTLAVTVSADADTLAWLDEFLSPAFTATDGDTGEVSVALADTNPADHPTGEARDVVAFAFDAGPRLMPAVRTNNGMRMFGEHGETEFDVSDEARHAVVWPGNDRLRARVRLMRVVREYAHNRALGDGHVILHGAAVAVAQQAVVFTGPKGSGKTTTALRWLDEEGVQFLANDRVLVRDVRAPKAEGLPTVVAFREGSRSVLPRATAQLASSGDFRETASARRARGDVAPLTFGGAWHLSVAQLIAACGSTLCASAPLGVIVVLDDDGGVTIEELSGDAAARAVAGALLGPRGSRTSDVFVTPRAVLPTDAALERTCRELAQHTRCLRVPARRWTPQVREWLRP